MQRIVIVLDGSELPASILPVARRHAGPGDELVLACLLQPIDLLGGPEEVNGGEPDLQREVETLRKSGVSVRAELLPAHDLPAAISRAVERFHPDMIAVAARSRVDWLHVKRAVASRDWQGSPTSFVGERITLLSDVVGSVEALP
jgi:hypothetical protein